MYIQVDNMLAETANPWRRPRVSFDLSEERHSAPLIPRRVSIEPPHHRSRTTSYGQHLADGTFESRADSAVPRGAETARQNRRRSHLDTIRPSDRPRHPVVATREPWVEALRLELNRGSQGNSATPQFGVNPRPLKPLTAGRQSTHTYAGPGQGRTVPSNAIGSDSEEESPRPRQRTRRRVTSTTSRPGSFHTRVFVVEADDIGALQQRESLEAQRDPRIGVGSARTLTVSEAVQPAVIAHTELSGSSGSAHSADSNASSPTVSLASPLSNSRDAAQLSPPPKYKSGIHSPYSDIAISRVGSGAGLNLLGLDLALQRSAPSALTTLVEVTSPSRSLPPSYHTSPNTPFVPLPARDEDLAELPNPHMAQRMPAHAESSSRGHAVNLSFLAMPVPLPTGHDSRRYSAPAEPVHIGYRSLQPPPPPMNHYPTSPASSSAPPVPRRPTQPYIAPKPRTMPDTALRLRALSFANRINLDRPLPLIPPERSESLDSQVISEGDGEEASPLEADLGSPLDEHTALPAPPQKPLLHYAYHPTHVSSYTRDVLPLPISLHPARHPLPPIIPIPPSPAAFQIMAPSFEDILQRLFESGTSRVEPTPDVYEKNDEPELSAWLRFFKVVPTDGDLAGQSGRRFLPFRRKIQTPEYRIVLGLQLADAEAEALSRVESSSSSRNQPSSSASSPTAPPPGATSSSGPNPLLDMSDTQSTLESTWFVPVTFSKRLPCPCSLTAIGEALFKAEQESRQPGSKANDNGDRKLWQVIQSHRIKASSLTESGVTSTLSASPSVATNASSDVRFEDVDLVPRGKTKGILRRMTMVVADAGSGVGALRTGKKERVRERDLRANFVTPFRAASPT